MLSYLLSLACVTTSGDSDSVLDSLPPQDTGVVTPTPLTVRFEGADTEGLVLQVSAFASTETGLTVGTTYAIGAMDQGAVTLELPVPERADLSSPDPEHPEMSVVYAAALLFQDNGNLRHDLGEPILGGSAFWLLYVDSPTSVMQFIGFRQGWNATRSVGGLTQVIDLDGVPLTLSLLTQETMSLSGSYDDAYGPGRVAMLPSDWFTSPDGRPVLVDNKVKSTWSVQLDGAPPTSHLLPADDPSLPLGAIELPFFYLDLDGNKEWTVGQDQPALPACYQDQMALAVWLPAAISPAQAVGYMAKGLRPGWTLAQRSETGLDFLGPESYTALEFKAACGF